MEELTLTRRDDGDENNGDGCGDGGGGYEVTCNILRTGKKEGGSSAKDVSERLREWLEEDEEERQRRRSAEYGARLRDELLLLSSFLHHRYVEEVYRVGTMSRQCLEVLSSIVDDDKSSSSMMDNHNDEVRERFRSNMSGN